MKSRKERREGGGEKRRIEREEEGGGGTKKKSELNREKKTRGEVRVCSNIVLIKGTKANVTSTYFFVLRVADQGESARRAIVAAATASSSRCSLSFAVAIRRRRLPV